MDTPTPERVPLSSGTVQAIVTNDVIQAYNCLAEGFIIAFEGCESIGQPLNDIQKQEIMQCMMFSFSEFRQDVLANASFMFGMTKAFNEDPSIVDEILNEDSES